MPVTWSCIMSARVLSITALVCHSLNLCVILEAMCTKIEKVFRVICSSIYVKIVQSSMHAWTCISTFVKTTQHTTLLQC